MAINPAVLDALLQAGATAEMIVAAVKADLANDEARREAKRANNAERQRRYRVRHGDEITQNNASNALRDVTERDPSLSRPLSPQTPLTPTHTHPDNNTRARKGGTPAKPENVSDQVWSDFLDLRKRKRAPLTETALAGIKREAEKAGWSLEAALAKCLARGWQGLEAAWLATEGPPGRTAPSNDFLAHLVAKDKRTGPPA